MRGFPEKICQRKFRPTFFLECQEAGTKNRDQSPRHSSAFCCKSREVYQSRYCLRAPAHCWVSFRFGRTSVTPIYGRTLPVTLGNLSRAKTTKVNSPTSTSNAAASALAV